MLLAARYRAGVEGPDDIGLRRCWREDIAVSYSLVLSVFLLAVGLCGFSMARWWMRGANGVDATGDSARIHGWAIESDGQGLLNSEHGARRTLGSR